MKQNKKKTHRKGKEASIASKISTTIGHVISHTHWDREWRVSEWNSRARLITMFNKLLQKFDKSPDFTFLFDGQVVSVEDFLDMCPEQYDTIKKLVTSGRLQIGPWYNLPDLYPICGEALIRNLLTGRRRAEKLGGWLDIAYTTFGWGQTAQFPQIFKGFGIDKVICGKNVSPIRAPQSEFYWESPDGTRLLTTRLGVEKRANFFFFALMPVQYGTDYASSDTRIQWGHDGWLWHRCDSRIDSELTFIPNDSCFPDKIEEAVKAALETADDSVVKEHIFLGNGCDSTAPSDVVDVIIEKSNQIFDDVTLKYSTLKEYFEGIEQVIRDNDISLKTVHGELRDGPVHKVSANALATRMPLKILNRKAQASLIRYAEPFACFANILGVEYPSNFLEKAWHFLLLAHSHDAINGVTLDKTAEDTANKLKQVIEISQVVTDQAAVSIMKKVDVSAFETEDVLVAVFNPLPYDCQQVVQAHFDIDSQESPRFLSVVDQDGEVLKSQPVSHYSHQAPVCVENSRALPFYADRHEMYFETGMIPAMGYKVLKLQPEQAYDKNLKFWNRVFEFSSQVTGPNTMANPFIEVKINPDGTYDLTSKSDGKTYRGLGFFEDGGDTGDYWQREKPSYDRVYNSVGREADIYLKTDGPLVTTYVIENSLEVPARAENKGGFRSSRSCEKALVKITTELTLRADCPYCEAQVTVDNQAFDHRLRIGFPTHLEAEYSDAMGHFNVDSRPIARPYENGIRDAGMGTLPMQNFVDVSDGQQGFAVLNKDLIEYEISEDPTRTVYLTLLRCMDVNICTEGRCATIETGATGPQCLGKTTFHYALYPHKGNWQSGQVYPVCEKYVYPPMVYQFSKHGQGYLPQSSSMLRIDDTRIQMSSFKAAQDSQGLIVRLYNPHHETISTEITFAAKVKKASSVSLNEDILREIPVRGETCIPVELGPLKIETFLVELSYISRH